MRTLVKNTTTPPLEKKEIGGGRGGD